MLRLLSVHVTSVLFLVRFNNFALTMGFYWSCAYSSPHSYTLLVMCSVAYFNIMLCAVIGWHLWLCVWKGATYLP